jgi:hypothetical protein
MTTLGWIFLLSSTAFVWGLTGWCFWKVLTAPPEVEQEIAEDLEHFHSA